MKKINQKFLIEQLSLLSGYNVLYSCTNRVPPVIHFFSLTLKIYPYDKLEFFKGTFNECFSLCIPTQVWGQLVTGSQRKRNKVR